MTINVHLLAVNTQHDIHTNKRGHVIIITSYKDEDGGYNTPKQKVAVP